MSSTLRPIVTDIDEQSEYQANIWICDGRMIMARLNPLKPEAIPYKFVPYESVLHRFWGIGIPYMMNDSQDVMNSTGRALLDNAALTAGPMFQMDVSKLPEGVSLEDAKRIYPYRLWFYDGAAGEGPIIDAINIQSNKPDAFPPADHQHAITDTQGLDQALAGKPDDTPVDGKQYARKDNGWAEVDGLPDQTGHQGKALVTDGTRASWQKQTGGGGGGDVEEAPQQGVPG